MKFFSTEGRLNRAPFIGYSFGFGALLTVLILVWTVMIMPESGNADDINWENGLALGGLAIIGILWLVWTIVYIMMCIRRLHDLDKDGLFVIAAFVPTVNFVFYLYLAIVKGTNGPNKYGEDPLMN